METQLIWNALHLYTSFRANEDVKWGVISIAFASTNTPPNTSRERDSKIRTKI
jgi:hypothetical protein